MKRFVEIIGFIAGIFSIIAGLVAIILGIVLNETVWLYVLYGSISILSGVFWCGLIGYISEQEVRLERIEQHLGFPEQKETEKQEQEENSQEKYYRDANGLWQISPSNNETDSANEEEEGE